MGFDPLMASNWELLGQRAPAKLQQAVYSMASHFKGSYKLAVMDAFPELRFSETWLQGIKSDK